MSSPTQAGPQDEPAQPQEQQVLVPCLTCREAIRAGAKKCIHCDSFQDWRGKLTVSSSVLALIVALVSVLGATLPAWKAALTPHDSDVKIFFIGLSGQRLHVMIANSGDRPAGILKTWLRLKQNNEYITIQMGGPSGEIHENLTVVANVSTNFKFAPEHLQNASAGCELGIEVLSFRRNKEISTMDVAPDMCREFMMNHKPLDWQ